MGSKGSQTTQASSTQTSSADPRAAAVYADILQRAETASQQGYQPYTGQQVAGFSPDQLAAMQGVSGIQGTYQPMLNQAAQYATAAGQPISASQINAAMSPYIQGVINPTLDIMSTQQAQEMSKLRGTEAQQGAFGGSRSAVAEANLANQQLQAKNQMVAGLMQQGYSQAVAQARADRAAAAQGAGISTGVASAQVATPLQALGAELQTGGLQQQLQQAQLNVPYQQYLQAQAYPYQQLSWLSGIAGGIGPGLGGTSTGQSTSVATPAQPSALSQILGGGLALGLAPFTGGASLAALPGIVARSATGGRINKADGGSVGMGDIDVASTMARALQLADAEMTQPAPMADGGAVGNDGDDIVQGALRMAQAMKRHLGGSASHMADGGVPGATLGTIDVGGKKIVNIFPASSGRGATLHAPNVSYAQSGSIKTPDYGETIKGLGAAFKQPEKSAQTPTKLTPAQMSDGTIAGEAGAFSANIPTPTFSPVSFQESFGYASGGLVPHHAQDGGAMFDPTPLEQQVPDNLVSAEEPAPITGETIPLPRARPEPKQSDTFSRMLRQESGGQQFDRSGQPLTSPKGAIGIAQIMPGTAPEAAQLAGLEYDPERLRNDAEYNKALGQAYYNKQLGDFGGNEQLAAAAYNAGPGRVRQALARARQEGGSYLNYLPTETQKYVANVVGEAPTGQEALAFSGEPQPYSAKIMANAIADLQGQRPEGGPLPYTGEEGRVPAPTPQQAAKADRAASIFERLTGIELSPEARMGLMAMGLRMMTTPGSVGTAIGAGGMQGLATYAEAQKAKYDQAVREAQVRRELETERHNRAVEAIQLNRQQITPISGYETPEGHPMGMDHRTGKVTDLITGKPVDPDASVRNTKNVWKPYDNKVTESGDPILMNGQGQMMNASTKVLLGSGDKIIDVKTEPLTDQSLDGRAYQLSAGDIKSAYAGLGFGDNRNKKLINERALKRLVDSGMTIEQAAKYLSDQTQEFAARGTGMSAEARTAGTREANLGIILKATDAAIPAALEASAKVARTNWLPLNQIIQKGQVIASNPELREFGMANLQLAEHWARAMNPTGVMRESDRDLALGFLSTADSPETYKRVVAQLKKQIEREKAAVSGFRGANGANAQLGKENALTYDQSRSEIEKQMTGASTAAPAPAAPAPTGSAEPAKKSKTPPPGATQTRRDTKGNLWYLDKDGKPLERAD